jgi:hypothetical protein
VVRIREEDASPAREIELVLRRGLVCGLAPLEPSWRSGWAPTSLRSPDLKALKRFRDQGLSRYVEAAGRKFHVRLALAGSAAAGSGPAIASRWRQLSPESCLVAECGQWKEGP